MVYSQDVNLPKIRRQVASVKRRKTTISTLSRSSIFYMDGLVQERRNSSALAMEFRLSCTAPSILGNKYIFLIDRQI